ncbi:hypothetical protein CVM50_14275 [Pseudooceanicola marinus]|nr:hypothetical protein CVM50_14275 [Pseudooceanicola marinus]
MTRVPLFTPHLLAVCTPAVAERLGPKVDLSLTTRIASRNRMEDWPNWMAAAGRTWDDKKPLMVFSNSTLVYEAALAGNGVAIAQLELVLQDLAEGRLVRPARLSRRCQAPGWKKTTTGNGRSAPSGRYTS